MRTGPGWNRLGELVVPACTWRVIGPVHPSAPKEGLILSRIVVSPDSKEIAHSVALPYEIVVRGGVTGAAVAKIDPSPLALGPDLLYSPDGKYLHALERTHLETNRRRGATYFSMKRRDTDWRSDWR